VRYHDYEYLFNVLHRVDAALADLTDNSMSHQELDWICHAKDKLVGMHQNVLYAMGHREKGETRHE